MKREKTRCTYLLVITALICGLAGCAAQKVQNYETSGFMKSYAGFVPGGEDQMNLIYLPQPDTLEKYDKVLIDHVVVYFLQSSKNKGIDPNELNQLCDYFHKALIKALQTRYTVVDKAGPDVLRVRSAITDLEPRGAVAGTLSTVVPLGAAVSVIKKTVTDSNLAVGRASVEIELVDSLSGQRLAAAIDSREGGKKVITSKWSDIEDALEYWSKKLAMFLGTQQSG